MSDFDPARISGEHSIVAPISVTRLTIPLMIAIVAAGGLTTAGALLATTHAQLADHESRISHMEARVEPVPLQVQHVEDELTELQRSMARVEHRLGTDK